MTIGMVDVARFAARVATVLIYDHHIDFAANQICDQLRYQSEIAVGGSPFDHHIASLSVSRVSQSLPKRLRFLALERQAHEEDSDVPR